MQSKATTVAAYLAQLPDDRKAALQAIRKVILANLDKGYEESIQYGHIGYYVPHSVYPPGYHCDPRQPLPFVAIASQKQHMAIYMMGLYCGCSGNDETAHVNWFREAWARTGKKLDMGKSCIRFKKLEDVALDVLGEAVKRQPASLYIKVYEQSLADQGIAYKGKRSGATLKPVSLANKPVTKPTKKATKRTAKQPTQKVVKAATKKASKQSATKRERGA